MSVTRSQPTLECKYPECSIIGRKWEFTGKYCSPRCETKHEGYKELKPYRFDHKLCFTCMRPLKEVEPPKPDFEFTENGHGWTLDEDGEATLEYYSQEVTSDAATGFQYLTKFAGKGEKGRAEKVITGTICDRCGNTDHRHHDTIIATDAAIDRLIDRLQADEVPIDPTVLRGVYKNTEDIDLAVGSALPDDD